MKTLITTVAATLKKTTGRFALTAALAGAAAASTAGAHERDGVKIRGDLRPACVEVRPVRVEVRPIVEVRPVVIETERREWVEARFEERQTKFFVEPVYQTVPGEKVFIEPVYHTVVDRIRREPIVREEKVRVFVPAVWIEREGQCHKRERILIGAHYDVKCETVIVRAGFVEEVARQELVAAGHWQCGPDRQVLVTAGHFEVKCERICVTPAHWEVRPAICVR